MSKLTDEEKKLIKEYEEADDERKSELHEVLQLDVIKQHLDKFGGENLQFFGLLGDNKCKTYLVKDW